MTDTTAKPDIDTALVRQLAEILSETGLGEIEVESQSLRVRVARPQPTVTAVHQAAPMIAPAPLAPPVAAAAPAPAPALAEHPGAVKSPMVGTAYLSPEPGAAPFVTTGAAVRKGQTVLIVEAMKVMNTIPSPRDGTVMRVLVENGQPVEYGEVMLVIE